MTVEVRIVGNPADKCFDFTIPAASGPVPASFWRGDDSAGKPPLTLVQHGGPLHKRHERTDWLSEAIVAATGSAVLLIDGPIHGQRRTDQPELMQMLGIFKQYWRDDAGIDGLVADWKTALNTVLDQGWADPERVAWLGVSMGTAYGIPLCAEEPRIKAAAMGMWGTDWGQEARLLADARRMQTPTLFQIKLGDEIFSTAGQRELFDALGSPDKCLHSIPGGHGLDAPGQLDQLLDFIARSFAGEAPHSKTDRSGKVTAPPPVPR